MHTRKFTVKGVPYDIPLKIYYLIQRYVQRYVQHIESIDRLTKTNEELNATIQRQNEIINKLKAGVWHDQESI